MPQLTEINWVKQTGVWDWNGVSDFLYDTDQKYCEAKNVLAITGILTTIWSQQQQLTMDQTRSNCKPGWHMHGFLK